MDKFRGDGNNDTSTISNCTNSGNIKCYGTYKDYGTYYGMVGGICGNTWHNTDSSAINNCENLGEVTGNAETIFPKGISAGGIVGNCDNLEITACSNKGKIHYDILSGVTENGGCLGGIVGGCVNTTIDQCFNTATITSKYNNNYGMINVAGIVGYIQASTVKNTYNTGDIEGKYHVGGIIGHADALAGVERKNKMVNSYNESKNINGTNNTTVCNMIGNPAEITVQYVAWTKEANLTEIGVSSGKYKDYKDDYTREEMKTLNSGLLTLLSNGEGKGIWEQKTDVNSGLPYLKNNRP